MARSMDSATGVSFFKGSRRHGMNEGPLLAFREACRQRQADKRVRDRARDAAAAKRTPQEQLRRLDALLGKGRGARRERARIAAKLGKR